MTFIHTSSHHSLPPNSLPHTPQDPGTTGNFEIVDMSNMATLYSKKVTNNKCTTPEEREELKRKIEEINDGK